MLFAEAGRDVADFLFSLLALPLVSTAVKLLGKASMIRDLYRCVQELDAAYRSTSCPCPAQGIVTAMPVFSIITLLNAFAVRGLIDRQERIVATGHGAARLQQGGSLDRRGFAVLQSKIVLTDVFLRQNGPSRA
ncbi:hypothetical protein QOZ80_2AG0143870 [Eleusine coracana subsp. coracana]|nr:hypothetical protein QOZ80_2AG0143870 [Eleusine coracana subsp. coracana]